MIEGKKIIAIIPARGGSKGLEKKNIVDIGGKPLLAWSIEHAQKSKLLDYYMVSTDDEEIASVARNYDGPVPFLRPNELATDTANPVDAVLDALSKLENQGQSFDYILLLQPTSPLREEEDIDNMIRLLHENRETQDALTSLGEALVTPFKMKKVLNDKVIPLFSEKSGEHRRQDLETSYFPFGVGYVIKVDVLKKTKTFYPDRLMPYFIKRHQCYEIDDLYDKIVIEAIMKYNKIGLV